MDVSTRAYGTLQELPAWGTADAPPTAFRIFPFGSSHATLFGRKRETVYLTRQDALSIVAEWKRRNIHGALDFNHELREAAGWFEIEVRDDGLYAVKVQWTAPMVARFAAKQYRYYSPYFGTVIRDKKTYVVELLNVAITNFPATDNQRPLIALSAMATRRYSNMDASTAKALAAKIISALKADEAQTDSIALLLMEGEAPADMPPAEEMAAAPQDEEMLAVAQAAFTATGATGREAIGALKALATAAKERDIAVKELSAIKHSAEVEKAIADRKLAPSMREVALATDPKEFLGAMRFASPIVDTAVLTPKTKEVQPADVINDEMRAYCRKHNTDVEAFAKTWVSKWGNVPFSTR